MDPNQIKWQRNFWLGVAAITGFLSFVIFWLLMRFVSSTPVLLGLMLILALALHEIGHNILFEKNGIPSRMIFLVLGGGASPLKEFEFRYDILHWDDQASILLWGPLGNTFAIFLFTIVFVFSGISAFDLGRAVNLNSTLIFWNLIPWWKFDGGRLTKIIFNSTDEKRDPLYAMVIIIAFIFTFCLVYIWTGFDFPPDWHWECWAGFALIICGIPFRATHDDPWGSEKPQAIPRAHRWRWLLYYTICLCVAFLGATLTPTWILDSP